MLPTPEISVWSSSARLTSVRRRRSAGHERRPDRTAGRTGRGRCARSPRGSVGAARRHGQPAERALVDEAQLRAAVGEREPDPQVRPRPARPPAAPAAGPTCRGGRRPRRRRPAAATGTCRAGRRRPRSGRPARRRSRAGAGQVPAHGPRVAAPRRRRSGGRRPTWPGPAGPSRPRAARARRAHLPRRASASGSSPYPCGRWPRRRPRLGRGGPRRRPRPARTAPARPPRRPAARPPSCCAPRRRRSGSPADHHPGGERLGVVGPGLVDPVLRHAQPERGGQLLQAGLPVQARRRGRADSAISGSKSWWITVGGRVQAVLQVDRAEQRLERVGQDARLVAPAGGLLALAEQQVRAEAAAARARAPRRPAPAC